MNTNAFRRHWNAVATALEQWIGLDLVLLVSRVGIAAVFFYSGRTKVESWLTVTDGAVALFRDEYRLPLLDPVLAAHAAAYAEHLFPILLALGLATPIRRARAAGDDPGDRDLRLSRRVADASLLGGAVAAAGCSRRWPLFARPRLGFTLGTISRPRHDP